MIFTYVAKQYTIVHHINLQEHSKYKSPWVFLQHVQRDMNLCVLGGTQKNNFGKQMT